MKILLKFKVYILSACLFVTCLQNAQSESSDDTLFNDNFLCSDTKTFFSSEKSNNFLMRIQAAYEKISTLKANFIQSSYMAALDISEVSSGEVLLKAPGKMKWDYRKPEPQIFLVSHPNVWLHQPKENMTIIDKFDSFVLSDVPVAFLLGLGKLQKSFEIKFSCKVSKGMLLTLKPIAKKDAGELKEFLLLVSEESLTPVGAQVYDVGNNKTSIIFSEIRLNSQISSKEFNPPSKKYIDVIDRRKL